MIAFYHLYERQIKRKAYTEELITTMVDDALAKGRLTASEHSDLLALIAEYYAPEE